MYSSDCKSLRQPLASDLIHEIALFKHPFTQLDLFSIDAEIAISLVVYPPFFLPVDIVPVILPTNSGHVINPVKS